MFELAPATKKLLKLFSDAEYGREFTYAEILKETGCDLVERDRQRIYTVVRRLERDHRRTLLNLRGRGYKVALAREHVSSMRIRGGKAKKQVSLARRTGEATPLDRLDDMQRRELVDQMAFNAYVVDAFRHQSRWNYNQDQRILAIEQELKALRGRDPAVIEGEVVEEHGEDGQSA